MNNVMPTDRSLTFFGPIRAPLTIGLRSALCTFVNEGAKSVTILFASEGGSTDDGIALHTYLTALPLEITMHAVGFVSSIAIPVFLAAPKRLASKNANFYFHEFSWTHPQATTLTQSTMTEQAMLLDAALQWTKDVVKATTKFTDSDFNTMKLFDHPVLVGAADAAKHGIVSSVTEPTIPASSQPRIVA